ncbi:MAG: hypothetical protein D6808_05115, partial [Candidatus Dadabacteria bacterium]
PWFDWLKDPLKEYILDTVSSTEFLHSHIWRGDKIKLLAENFYSNGTQNKDKGRIARVWRCVQAFHLMRLFKDFRYYACTHKEIRLTQ